MIKPMGVYGSRQEIVRFLLSIGAIDDATLVFLPRSIPSILRSIRTGPRSYLRQKMTLPELLTPRCGQGSISSDRSTQTTTDNCSFCIGPKKQHGMILPFHLYDATVLLSSGRRNVTLM